MQKWRDWEAAGDADWRRDSVQETRHQMGSDEGRNQTKSDSSESETAGLLRIMTNICFR